MTRVAVLGAGGFLGSHIVPALLARPDTEVLAVDHELGKLDVQHTRLRRHASRIGAPGFLEQLIPRVDVVLSLTALCTPALYSQSPLEVIDANYTDLVPVVRLCTEQRVRLIHFSTCEVYGRVALNRAGEPAASMNEEETGLFLGPVQLERWSYACAKQLLERVIWAQGQHHGLDFSIIRPFNVIGPRMDFLPGVDGDGVPRVLACFMNALLRAEPLLLVNGGRQRRAFIGVDEFVRGVLAVFERPEVCRGEIFNLGSPLNDVSIRELAEALAHSFARRMPEAPAARFRDVTAEEFYGAGYDDSEARVPDIAKATRLLDFEPRESLADVLPGIVEDYVGRYAARLGWRLDSEARAASA